MGSLAERKAVETLSKIALQEGIGVKQGGVKSFIEPLVPYKNDPLTLFQSEEWGTVKEKISAMPPTLKAAAIDYLCKRLGLNGDFKRAIKEELLPKEEPKEKLEPWPEPVDGGGTGKRNQGRNSAFCDPGRLPGYGHHPLDIPDLRL